jgi:dTDP-glucose pyrophosphorylase
MHINKYVGAILAAGRGSRMQPFSERYPKPLLPVCNRPLILHQIETMRSLGIHEIFVLVGHKGYEIAGALGDGSQHGVRIKYVEQVQMLGIAHAVGLLERHIRDPFLLMLGDIYFVPTRLELMRELFEQQGGGGVLGTKQEHDPQAIQRNFAILLRKDGTVSRVVEKPRHAPNQLKGVGIYLLDTIIFDAIRRTPRTALRDEYELTDAIQVMIDDGNPVRPANVVSQDINLTTPADLLLVNLLHAAHFDPASAIAPNVNVHPNARLENCVVGANVHVRNPILMSHSLVFEGTTVTAEDHVDRLILTPYGNVDCRSEVEMQQLNTGMRALHASPGA